MPRLPAPITMLIFSLWEYFSLTRVHPLSTNNTDQPTNYTIISEELAGASFN